MAKHEVKLTISRAIQIGNVDIEFDVRSNGRKTGTLKISKGGLDWVQSGNSVNAFKVTWEEFAKLMNDHGSSKKLK